MVTLSRVLFTSETKLRGYALASAAGSRWYACVILAALVFSLRPTFAQPLFQETYGGPSDELGYSVQQTSDGGYIIAGYTNSFGAGGYDVYLVKTDALGDTLWTRAYGGISYDFGHSVQQTSDGGYIIAGSTYSFGAGDNDAYLIKTDSRGDTLWTRTYGRFNSDYARSVRQTSDGGYIIAGSTWNPASVGYDIYVIKTDSMGETLWSRTYGGPSANFGYSAQQTSDGGYIILGTIRIIQFWFFPDYGLTYLLKTNSVGDTLWTKKIGLFDDYSFAVEQTSDGGYVLAGSNYWGYLSLAKTNPLGDRVWEKQYGVLLGDSRGYSVHQTADEGYLIAGSYSSKPASDNDHDIYLIKTNSLGDTLWTRNYGGTGNDVARSLQLTSDGGCIIAGYTNSFGSGGYDMLLIKIAPDSISGDTFTRKAGVPAGFALKQNYPNPFNPTTTIQYDLPENVTVSLRVYTSLGQEVATLANGEENAGYKTVLWDASRLPSGVYFYRLQATSTIDPQRAFTQVRRAALVR